MWAKKGIPADEGIDCPPPASISTKIVVIKTSILISHHFHVAVTQICFCFDYLADIHYKEIIQHNNVFNK